MVTIDEIDLLIRERMRGKVPADATIGPETVLKDLGLSSLQLADIVFTLEERHDVEFDVSKAADVETVGQMVEIANDALAAEGLGERAHAG